MQLKFHILLLLLPGIQNVVATVKAILFIRKYVQRLGTASVIVRGKTRHPKWLAKLVPFSMCTQQQMRSKSSTQKSSRNLGIKQRRLWIDQTSRRLWSPSHLHISLGCIFKATPIIDSGSLKSFRAKGLRGSEDIMTCPPSTNTSRSSSSVPPFPGPWSFQKFPVAVRTFDTDFLYLVNWFYENVPPSFCV